MKLSTILGKKPFTRDTNLEWIEENDLKLKFFCLSDSACLVVYSDLEHDLYYCGDESGKIYYKQIEGLQWFKWEPKP
jgi:hypothetical protein